MVCEQWMNSFSKFLLDMGRRPPGTTLGRFGDQGNYEPTNVKWMTFKEQWKHRKKSEIRKLADLANVPYKTMWARLKHAKSKEVTR